ncbi:hypothetical protein [Reinekea blandensis]|uniref:Uncharacterized protein n=1 Tax=Reinekea blandensis MED297 TaxID=314283 RepID=A4BFI7_9GAMM|nr:hypothetical protein [Reinekea blandensis]EAR09082.1 hypothetical protein MED297_17108 [Reinekea sp. MED297] [Reinekea blandensis MED297]
MRVVPANRLLIQPTVQLSWIRQHGDLEFVVAKDVQDRFLRAWTRYRASDHPSLAAFLADDQTLELALHEDDAVFALLTGADTIESALGPLRMATHQPNLTWTLT